MMDPCAGVFDWTVREMQLPRVNAWLAQATDRDRARDRLYVGMSRATDQLVVVGDPEVVRRVGGDAVAKRLGIG